MHGYNLAKELSRLGYELFKINGEPEPHTTRLNNPVTGLIWMLRNCDLFYIRMDYFLNLRNLVILPALLFGKKVIVELNSPSDELHLFGKSKKQIRRRDKIMSWLLKKTGAVVAVSEPIKQYCEEALGLSNVTVIENGGEVFEEVLTEADPQLKQKISNIKQEYEKLVVWSGSLNKMQDLDMLRQFQETIGEKSALILIIKKDNEHDELTLDGENWFLFNNLSRRDVSYIIAQCDVGLAFYNEYPWSRWGFYNSSLKIYEFLNNGLLTITNTRGRERQRLYPNFRSVDSISQIEQYIQAVDEKISNHSKRTWKTVAEETSELIDKIAKS